MRVHCSPTISLDSAWGFYEPSYLSKGSQDTLIRWAGLSKLSLFYQSLVRFLTICILEEKNRDFERLYSTSERTDQLGLSCRPCTMRTLRQCNTDCPQPIVIYGFIDAMNIHRYPEIARRQS